MIRRKTILQQALAALFFFAIQAASGLIGVYANDKNTRQTMASETPVLLVQNDWTSQSVLAQIVANLLEASDIPVELVPFDSQLQFQALADGHVHFQIAAWEGPMREAFNKATQQGMRDAGTHSATSREGWWIPDYVLDSCPGAAHWQGLNACASLFATDETNPAGRFIGPPLDWGKNYARRVAALQIDFRVVNVDNSEELWSKLNSAYQQTEPLVLFNWTPNFTDVQYAGRFVDFPEPADECESNAAWGSNPLATGDCGDPHSYWLKKAAWEGLEQMNPPAWTVLQRVNFTNAQIARAVQLVKVEGLSVAAAAAAWAEENPQVVDQWLDY